VSYDPVWSPVGDTILFVTAASGNDEIYRIGSDGSGLQQLTQNEWEWDKHPSWSPDGQQIVFFSNRSGQDQIYIMAADGSNVHPISDGNGNDTYPVWIK
jgi:TolB protein